MSKTTHKTYCRLCTAYCGLEVDVEDGRVREIRGDPVDPLSQGYSCLKGRQLAHQLHGPQRLHTSLVRREDGHFEPIATERALDEIAERIEALVSAHGPRSIASFSGTAAFANSATLPVVRAWHRGLRSTSNYSTLTLDQPAKMVGTACHGVWAGGGHSFASSHVALCLGINPIVSRLSIPGGVPGPNPAATLARAKRRGLKLICIDPRRSELARRADIHLQVRPGEDATLLAGMLRLILHENLHDADFCREQCEGLDEFAEALTDFTPDYIEKRTQVPAARMAEATRLFAAGPRGYASSGTGADMSAHPRLSAHLLCSLNTLCGRHNREGERIANPGVLSLPVPRPAQAIPRELLPPLLRFGDGPPARFRDLRGLFDEMPSATLAEEILTPGEGRIRALICVGANPLLAMPDPLSMRRALDALDLSVAIDVTLSATARRADYVIAARHALEREDVTEFMDAFYEVPYAHYTRALVEPEGDAIEDWAVFVGLARRLGSSIALPGGALDPAAKPSKLEMLERLFPTPRIPIARLREQRGGRIYDELDVRVSAPLPGIEAKLQFAPTGVVDALRALREEAFGPAVDETYPLRLVSRREPHVCNSVGHDFPLSRQRGTTNPAYLNPLELARIDVRSGEPIEIESRDGAIVAIAEASEELRPGVVSIAHCFGDESLGRENLRERGSNTGLLISPRRDPDPITGMPQQSAVPVRIRPARD